MSKRDEPVGQTPINPPIGSGPFDDPFVGEGQSAIAQNASILKGLLDSMADPIFVKDEHHRWVYGNTAFWDLLGEGAEEKFLFKDDRAIFPPEEVAVFWEIDDRITHGGETIENEETISASETKTVIARTKKSPFKLPNGRPGLVGVIRDITAEKKATQAATSFEREAKRKSEFLSAMSHELRTPLNGILGMAHALKAHGLPGHLTNMVDVIDQSGEQLLEMISNVLEISQEDGQASDLREDWYDLEGLVASSIDLILPRALEKGLELYVEVDPEATGHYWGDITRLRQVLVNLLSNAVNFTDEGSVSLNVGRVPIGPDEFQITAEVTDTGRGIAEDDIANVFEPFHRGREAKISEADGAGLGLAIVDRIVRHMNGTITTKSRLGEGTSFCLQLPTKFKAHQDGANKDDAKSEGPRLLCAEDKRVNRQVLKALLAPLGGEIVFALDGKEAVTQFRAGGFDAILMDVRMPVLDGLEATRAIRAVEKETGALPIPIIAVTANAFAAQVDDCFASGMDYYVSKPINADALLQTVTDAVEKARGGVPGQRAAG